MRADRDVFAHSQARERLYDLEGARDAAPREPMRRLARDIGAIVEHATFARRQEAGDDRKQRGLAGTIRSDQRGDPSGLGYNRCAIDRKQPAKAFGDVFDAKEFHGSTGTRRA